MTNKNTTERKVDEKAALKALSNISKAVADKRAAKRAAEEAARVAKRDARKAGILEILTTGTPSAKSDQWGIRYALAKAVTATKYGATEEELQACTALQAVTDWAELIAPVTEYCEAMAADTALIIAGLTEGKPAPAAEPAAEEPAAEPVAEEAKPAREPRQRKPRAPKGASKVA